MNILKRWTDLTMPQMKKPISRTVLPTESLSIDGGLSVPGMGVYSATLDRPYRQPGGMDYPTATVPRNYHYGPVGGYDDYRGGPPSEAYASLSRGSHMDDRYRWLMLLDSVLTFNGDCFALHSSIHVFTSHSVTEVSITAYRGITFCFASLII